MKLLLVRHAQSKANIDPNEYFRKKDHEIEITELGKKQASNLGNKILNNALTIDHAFVSPYKRTRQTFKLIHDELFYDIENLEYTPLLREQEYSDFKNKEESEISKKEQSSNKFFYRFQNGESYADVYARVKIFLNDLKMKELTGQIDKDDVVLIVSHEVTIRVLLMILDNLEEKDIYSHIDNCSFIERYF